MTELQERLLRMLKWYHEFCVANDLKYYAIGGTALGAVRHGGFIPWDDDIDVGMPRPDYERFKELANEKINGKTSFFAEFPSDKKDFVYPYGKLYDTRTTLIENTRYKTKRGVFIDVFPLDGGGQSKKEAVNSFHRIQKLKNVAALKTCSPRRGRLWIKNAAIVAFRIVPDALVNHTHLYKKMETLCKNNDFDRSQFVANYYGDFQESEIHGRNVFGTPTLHKFENIEIYIPEKGEEYLREEYGDWQKLPEAKKRVTRHDYIYLNYFESYLDN